MMKQLSFLATLNGSTNLGLRGFTGVIRSASVAALFLFGAHANAAPIEKLENLEQDLSLLTTNELEDLFSFVAGNTLFTLYHEAGHMLVSELNLPVLGKEENAVDNLATVSMLASDTEDMDLYLTNAMIGWFVIAGSQPEDMVYYGEHDLDEQRGYQTLCLMVGADPDAFSEVAYDLEMPEDRMIQCEDEYAKTAESWNEVTEPFARSEETAGGKINVSYQPAPEGLRSMEVFLSESKLMEQVGAEFDTLYDLPQPVKFQAASCGEENAFWDPEKREVTICYELLGGFAGLYLNALSD